MELSWDSEHDVCSPSAQGTVALEVGGKNPQPGNLFLFRFVFVSCVPCVRAGEAKLREGVRGRGASSTLVPRLATFPPTPPPALDFPLVRLLKKLVGVNRKSVLELLNLVVFCVFPCLCCYLYGF